MNNIIESAILFIIVLTIIFSIGEVIVIDQAC